MRGLAEYAMVGRRQAIIVVLLSGFFPMASFISAAIVGLAMLRKGLNEGLVILLWSLLPAGLYLANGDSSPMILMLSVALLSSLLKRNYSWQKILAIAAILGIFSQISLYWQTSYLALIDQFVSAFIQAQEAQGTPLLISHAQSVDLILGAYGAYHAVSIITCLMLARWWQAALYNPGGFQLEFHQLRIEPKLMLPIFCLILIGMLGIAPLDAWLTVLCIPPIFSGMALIHFVVKHKKMNIVWLVLGYIALMMMYPVIIIGLLDSVLDFRKRITT